MRLLQKLTPQQVQYLKLLQLPVLALEQRIKTELEINPVLEEEPPAEETVAEENSQEETAELGSPESPDNGQELIRSNDEYSFEDYMNDEIAGHKSPDNPRNWTDDEERYDPGIVASVPLAEHLLQQFRLQNDNETEQILAEEILGNIDDDGYLRRDLPLIVDDINLGFGLGVTLEQAEGVLHRILLLDPPGIGARTLQECLVAQAKAGSFNSALKELALLILEKHFSDFQEKRYERIVHVLGVTKDAFKKVLDDVILRLNPKPGEGRVSAHENYIIPDFIVEKTEDGEFIITTNDRALPSLRISKAYQNLYSSKRKKVSSEARDFIRKQFESAKFFITAIHQRRQTLLHVMKTIVEKQRAWFESGTALKPMIYKEIAEVVGYDISTISRVVNSKYVQTEYGVFPLRYFFTSGMTSETGEEVSALTLKESLKEIIQNEDALKPLSDEEIAKIFKDRGMPLARRTIAKYREQLGIPVARFRKKF